MANILSNNVYGDIVAYIAKHVDMTLGHREEVKWYFLLLDLLHLY